MKTFSGGNDVRRQMFCNVGFIAGLLVAGGLCGIGLRQWMGGLKAQHAQLERCILSSRQSHSSEDARSKLQHLDAEVPACMNASGYEQALGNQNCSPAFWQGDAFCYLPRSFLGKLVFRIEASSAPKKMQDQRKTELSPSQG